MKKELTGLYINESSRDGGGLVLPEFMHGMDKEVRGVRQQLEWLLWLENGCERRKNAIEVVVIPAVIEANVVAEQVASERFGAIRQRMEALGSNQVELALVGCIDGRLYSVLQAFPRLVSFLKTPAGLLKGVNDLMGGLGKHLPPRLMDRIRGWTKKGKVVIELLSTHTSLRHRGHGCGAHKASYSDRVANDPDMGVAHDLTRKERKNTRELFGNTGAQVVDVTIDTDTQSIVVFAEGFVDDLVQSEEGMTLERIEGEHDNGQVFYTTKFVDDNREEISLLNFWEASINWDDPRKMLDNLDTIVSLAEKLNDSGMAADISNRLGVMFPNLSDEAKLELRSQLLYNISVLYLSGFTNPDTVPERFKDHNERFANVGDKGFDFSPSQLPFLISTSEGDKGVGDNIRVMSSLLPGILESAHRVDLQKQSMVAFVSAPAEVGESGQVNRETHARIVETLTRQYAMVAKALADSGLDVSSGSVLLVPVIVDQKTRQVVEIVDLSDYMEEFK